MAATATATAAAVRERDAGAWVWSVDWDGRTARGLAYGMDGGGKRVMEEGLGGKMVEVLAGGGLAGCLFGRVGGGGGRNFRSGLLLWAELVSGSCQAWVKF